jgi:hypothetical protein
LKYFSRIVHLVGVYFFGQAKIFAGIVVIDPWVLKMEHVLIALISESSERQSPSSLLLVIEATAYALLERVQSAAIDFPMTSNGRRASPHISNA